MEGVYSVQEPHFWTLCSDVYVGTIKLEVAANADGRYLVSQTHNIFTQVSLKLMIIISGVKLKVTFQFFTDENLKRTEKDLWQSVLGLMHFP